MRRRDLGQVFRAFARLAHGDRRLVDGHPWTESQTAGSLLGTKTVLNELLAYLQMAELPPDALNERGRLILSYALCGFANLGSLGIMLGGMTAMAPERRAEIVELGPKCIVSGTIATCLTGTVVGLLTGSANG